MGLGSEWCWEWDDMEPKWAGSEDRRATVMGTGCD